MPHEFCLAPHQGCSVFSPGPSSRRPSRQAVTSGALQAAFEGCMVKCSCFRQGPSVQLCLLRSCLCKTLSMKPAKHTAIIIYCDGQGIALAASCTTVQIHLTNRRHRTWQKVSTPHNSALPVHIRCHAHGCQAGNDSVLPPGHRMHQHSAAAADAALHNLRRGSATDTSMCSVV